MRAPRPRFPARRGRQTPSRPPAPLFSSREFDRPERRAPMGRLLPRPRARPRQLDQASPRLWDQRSPWRMRAELERAAARPPAWIALSRAREGATERRGTRLGRRGAAPPGPLPSRRPVCRWRRAAFGRTSKPSLALSDAMRMRRRPRGRRPRRWPRATNTRAPTRICGVDPVDRRGRRTHYAPKTCYKTHSREGGREAVLLDANETDNDQSQINEQISWRERLNRRHGPNEPVTIEQVSRNWLGGASSGRLRAEG